MSFSFSYNLYLQQMSQKLALTIFRHLISIGNRKPKKQFDSSLYEKWLQTKSVLFCSFIKPAASVEAKYKNC